MFPQQPTISDSKRRMPPLLFVLIWQLSPRLRDAVSLTSSGGGKWGGRMRPPLAQEGEENSLVIDKIDCRHLSAMAVTVDCQSEIRQAYADGL